MPSLRDETVRKQLIERLQALAPATEPKWGGLDAPRVLCHLIDSLRMSLGEVSANSMNYRALRHFPLKHLVLYVFPFPKGARAAPELFATSPGDFEADRQRLAGFIDRLAASPIAKGPAHPLFGPLTNDEWNALQGKHIAHHLRQFGC